MKIFTKRILKKIKARLTRPPKSLEVENYRNVLHIWNIGACGSIMVKNLKKYGYMGTTIMRKSHDPFNVTELYGDQSLDMDGGEFYTYARKIAPHFGIIHIHGLYEIIPEYRRLFPKKILILHYHGSDIAACQDNEFRLKCVKDADVVLCSVPEIMVYAEKDPVPAYYIPNAVDQSIFKPMPEIKKVTDKAQLQTMRYLDLEQTEEYVKANCDWEYEVFDREVKQVPLFDMAKVYNQYSKLIDVKFMKNDPRNAHGKPGQAYSKAGLEALACGLEVFGYENKIVKGLPEEHTMKHQAKTLLKIYETLVNARFPYNPNDYWKKRGAKYKDKFVYTNAFKNQEVIVMNELSKLKFNSVIEFGCGFGRFTKLINDIYKLDTFEAFDLSIEQVNNAKKRCKNVEIKQSTIQTFKPKQQADLVFGVEVLMHIQPKDIEEYIKTIASWSTKYIVTVDGTKTEQSLEPHNFIHDYNNLLKQYGSVTEIKIGLQSVFICRKNGGENV